LGTYCGGKQMEDLVKIQGKKPKLASKRDARAIKNFGLNRFRRKEGSG